LTTTILDTPRLKLRTMEESDIPELLRTFADPKVADAEGGRPFGIEEMRQWVQRNLDHQKRHGYGLFTVLLKGDCGLERMAIDGEQVVELGYDLQSACWNRGYATEAATAVRDFAFGQLGVSELVSLIRVGNGASRRVAEKVGMRLAKQVVLEEGGGRRRQYWVYSVKREQ
jgi:ribosomal-protein-alanine N-acetyltransferase